MSTTTKPKPRTNHPKTEPETRPVFALNAMRLDDFATSVLGMQEGDFGADLASGRWKIFRRPANFQDLDIEAAMRTERELARSGDPLPGGLEICQDLSGNHWVTDPEHAKQVRALIKESDRLAVAIGEILFSQQSLELQLQ